MSLWRGAAGKDIYCSVNQSKYCEITGWVDQKYESVSNEEVKAPEAMLQMEFDYVLICIIDRLISDEVKRQMEKNGWNKGKQIVELI